MRYPQPRGIKDRVRERVKAKVRRWVDGHQMTYFDSPAGVRAEWDHPSYPTMKVLQSVTDDGDPIRVGKYSGVHYTTVFIPGGMHHVDWVASLHAHVEDDMWVNVPGSIHSNGPIVVGNDVFIAFEALVTSGVTIGDGAVVASRSVVIRDVEPYSIVGGNPAKHIRYRFDEPTRAALLRIRWWDWPVEKVTAHQHQIHSPDVAGFVARHDPELPDRSCEVCLRTG